MFTTIWTDECKLKLNMNEQWFRFMYYKLQDVCQFENKKVTIKTKQAWKGPEQKE